MKLQREKALFDGKVRKIVAGFAGDEIGWNQLEELAYDEDVKAHLSTFGFQSKDLEKLFWLIDDGSGKVKVDVFLAKVGGLKGAAKAIDMLTLLKLVHKVELNVSAGFSQMGLLVRNESAEVIEGQFVSIAEEEKKMMMDSIDDGFKHPANTKAFIDPT